MQKHTFSSLIAVIVAGLSLASSMALAAEPARKMFGKGNPFTVGELPAGKLKSKLQTLNPQAKGKAMKWLHGLQFETFDAAEHLRADKDGGIYIVCPDDHGNCDGKNHKHSTTDETESAATPTERTVEEPLVTEPPVTEGESISISSPPAYNSRPGATHHIYLDFNGASVSGKNWSETDGTTTWTSWACAAWSTDGNVNDFSQSELDSMRQVWERISEDYAPFDVNVTTDVAYDPVNFTGDKNKVGWLLFTNTTDTLGARCPHFGSGGVAYVGVYGNSNFFSNYQPAWVTPSSAANMAEAGSHEMGHNMGLSHDGTSSLTYYGGHTSTSSAPSWGPIMGTGYGRNVSQWSKGEYYGANQLQDDLAIISNRVTYRMDDHGDDFAGASLLSDSNVSLNGMVERSENPDYFTFNTAAGIVNFSAAGYKCETSTWGGNLDIVLELYDNNFNLVASSANADSDVNASLTQSVAAGEYYLLLKPSGAGDPMVSSRSGYSVYGSLGQYSLTGNFIPTDSVALIFPNEAETLTRSTIQTITWGSDMGGDVKIELLKGGVLQTPAIKDSTPNDGSFDWLIPATQTLASDYQIRITSIDTPAISDESVTNFAIILPSNNILVTNLDTDPGLTTTGLFEYGEPGGNNAAASPNTGTNMYDTDLDDTCWQASTLTTMALDCSKHIGVSLDFWEHTFVYLDYTVVFEVSNDGTNWTELYSATGSTSDTWVNHNYDISAVADGQSTVYVRWSMLGSGSQYTGAGLAIDDISITGTFVPDIAPFGVTLAQTGESTDVVEGGATDSYSLVLDTQPTANVTINISGDPDVSVSPISVTFSTSDWEIPRNIIVTAVDDSIHELLHTGTITHSATSSDLNYSDIPIENVVANVTDDDNNAPTVNAGPDQTIDLAQVGGNPVAGAYYEWDAANDATGDNVWNSTTANAYNWTFNSGSLSPVNVSDARFGSLTKAYPFPAAKDAANDSFDAQGSNELATFEFVLDVDGTDASIFETGGSGDGLQIDVVGGVLRGTVQEAIPARVSYTLSAADMGRFIHVVFVADSANDVVQLYVDGVLKDSVAWTGPDWSGTDNAALGTQAGTIPTGGSTAEFSGKMALFRYYRNKAFTLTDVQTNYDAVAGSSAIATLDGAVADGDNDPLTTLWTKQSGPGNVTFLDDSAAGTTATFDAEGSYVFRLTADDNINVVFDECLVVVNPPSPYVISLTETDGSTGIAEGGANDSYSLVLETQPTANVTVDISGDADVSASPTSVTFTPTDWDQAQSVTVSAVDDAFVEGNHAGTITHSVSSTDSNYSEFSVPNVTAAIIDDDAPGALALDSTARSVGEEDGSITLTVSRSGGSKGVASVTYITSNGTASSGSDYTAHSGTLTWADGNSDDKTITINISSDLDPENNETFTVNLSGESGASLSSPNSTTVTITDDDEPGSLALTSSSYSVDESAGTVTLIVTRSGGSAGAVSVDYATSDGTSVAGSDYVGISSGTLSWAAGDSASKNIIIQITNDTDSELDETFNVTLSNASVASMGSPSSATVTITDDDFSPGAIPDLVGWYDAQNISTSVGSDVTTWSDRLVGSNTTANHLTQVTGNGAVPPKLQTVILNGSPYNSVRFLPGASGNFELLKATGLTANQDANRTVITVYKGGSDSPDSRPVSFGSLVDGDNGSQLIFWGLATDGNGSMMFGGKGGNSRLINSQSVGLNRTDVLVRTSVMESGTRFDEYIDVLDASFADTQVLSDANPSGNIKVSGDLYVGDSAVVGGADSPTFDILEVLVFDRPLTDIERGQVQNYLKDKYTPAPVSSFEISTIAPTPTVNTPITGITITAKDASNNTVTTFTGTVDYGGSAGITGTSTNFVGGVLSNVNLTPTVAGTDLTLVVDDRDGHSGLATFTVQSAYAAWAGGPTFNVDDNNDGIDNGIAWFLGASNPSENATALLPTMDNTSDANYFIYNYRRSDVANADTSATIAVEYGSTLNGWATAVHDNDNVIISETNDGYGVGVDKVEVKIKRTLAVGEKLFSRIKVDITQ